MAKKQIDLGLTGLDELFMDDKERVESQLPKIYEIPLSEIDEFPNHPFHVRLDEDMDQLVESIKERGIITPVTLRQKPDGRYEIVSGHRRTKACELAGLTTVKAEIKELSRDEAIILMVESNLQRTTILPSEKAFSYKMRLEAMKRQGERSDLTSVPVAQKSKTSREELGAAVGESQDQVRRYIRLTHLIEPLLDLVDSGKIAFRPAVELSYLTEEEQNSLLDSINSEQSTPSLAQASKMKEFSQNGSYSKDSVTSAVEEYAQLLDLTGTGTMGYVHIPKLGVSLPIYHGTEEETLDRGVGHLIGSSLPIGGSSTHAILTGHSGLASQKMFSDLDKLEIGDTFYLEVLNEILAYEVDQINTVLPHDTTYLGLEEGKDLCTLVTCTPFGVNTHRLLIRGHRIAYTPEDEESPTTEPAETSEPVDSTWEQEYEKGVYFAIGVVVIICLVLFLGWLMQRGESRAS